MNTKRSGSAELWLRMFLFIAGGVALAIALERPLGSVLQQFVGTTPPWLFLAIASVFGALPLLLAALLAWFVPRPAGRPTARPAVGSGRILALVAGAAVLALVLIFAQSGVSSWSDSAGVATAAASGLTLALQSLPGALIQAFIALGILARLWGRVLSPAASGLAAGVTLALPPALIGLLPWQLSGEAATAWGSTLLGLIVSGVVWGFLYAGLAALLSGRSVLAATVIGGVVVALALTYTQLIGLAVSLTVPAMTQALAPLGLDPGRLIAVLLLGGAALLLSRAGDTSTARFSATPGPAGA